MTGQARPAPSGSVWSKAALALLVLLLPNQFAFLLLTGEQKGVQFALRPIELKAGVGGIYIAISDIVLLLIFSIWLVVTVFRRQLLKIALPPLPFVLVFTVAFLSALNAMDVWGSLQRSIAASGMSPRALLNATAFRAAATELVQITIYFLLAPTLFLNLLRHQSSPHTPLKMGEGRRGEGIVDLLLVLTLLSEEMALFDLLIRPDPIQVSGTFGSRNIYGGYLAMTLPLACAWLLWQSGWRRTLGLAALAMGMPTLLSGGALLAVMVGIFVTALQRSVRAGMVALALLVGVIALSGMMGARLYRDGVLDFVNLKDKDGDIKKEFIEWQAALNMLTRERPVSETLSPRNPFPLSVGLGNYQLNIGTHYGSLPNKEKMPFDSNSLYLVIASTTGFLGLAALLFLLIHYGAKAKQLAALRHAQGAAHSQSEWAKALGAGMVGALVGFGIVNIFTNLLVRGTALVFVLLLCLLEDVARNETASGGV